MSDNRNAHKTKYSRDFCMALRKNCTELPPGLDSDILSDLSEAAFFDRTPSEGLYLGPHGGAPPPSRHSALFSSSAGRGRGHFGAPPGGIRIGAPGASAPALSSPPVHSRLVDNGSLSSSPDVRLSGRDGAYNMGLVTAFAGSSPSKASLPGYPPRTRHDDPDRLDRWDSRKSLSIDPSASVDQTSNNLDTRSGAVNGIGVDANDDGGWTAAPSSSGRLRSSSLVAGQQASNMGGNRDSKGHSTGQGSLGSASSGGGASQGRWGKASDEGDWRARKGAGAVTATRYDWAEKPSGGSCGQEKASVGRSGGQRTSSGVPEWGAAEDVPGTAAMPMTAQDIEAERQRMQAEWRKKKEPSVSKDDGLFGASEEQLGMQDLLVDDDEIELWRKEQEEEEQREREQGFRHEQSSQSRLPPPVAGQSVNVGALFGAAPSSNNEEKMRSRFANVFTLEDPPAGTAEATHTSARPLPPGSLPGAHGPHGITAPYQTNQSNAGDAGKTLLAMLQKTSGPADRSEPSGHGQSQAGRNANIGAERTDFLQNQDSMASSQHVHSQSAAGPGQVPFLPPPNVMYPAMGPRLVPSYITHPTGIPGSMMMPSGSGPGMGRRPPPPGMGIPLRPHSIDPSYMPPMGGPPSGFPMGPLPPLAGAGDQRPAMNPLLAQLLAGGRPPPLPHQHMNPGMVQPGQHVDVQMLLSGGVPGGGFRPPPLGTQQGNGGPMNMNPGPGPQQPVGMMMGYLPPQQAQQGQQQVHGPSGAGRPGGGGMYTPQQLAQLQALQARMGSGNLPTGQMPPQQQGGAAGGQVPTQLLQLLGIRPPLPS